MENNARGNLTDGIGFSRTRAVVSDRKRSTRVVRAPHAASSSSRVVLDLPPSLQRISDSTPLDELDALLAQRVASSSLSASSHRPPVSPTRLLSPPNSTNGCELDLVEVISIDSSDDEDDGNDDRREVIPLELFVKHEAAPSRAAGRAASSGKSRIKYELRASSDPEPAAVVVDLCSDDDDDDDDRNNSGSDADTEALDSDSGGNRSNDTSQSHRAPSLATQYMYEHDWRSSSNTVIRFKRRKLQTSRVRLTSATRVIHSNSRSTDTVERMDVDDDDAPEVVEDDAYSTESFSDNDDAMDAADDDDTSDDDDDDSRYYPAPTASHTLTREQVNAIILQDVHALEVQKPWRHIYRCLELPFYADRTTDTFDLLFEQWDAFWRLNGRAVWERYFWAPLPPGSLEYGRRKHRQWRAARSFRALAADLCAKLGTDFLTPLAYVAHDGWWYRSAPLVLRELFHLDRRKYAMYMTLHRERFPRGSRFERSLDPEWCLDAALLAERDATRRADSIYKAWQDVASSDDE